MQNIKIILLFGASFTSVNMSINTQTNSHSFDFHLDKQELKIKIIELESGRCFESIFKNSNNFSLTAVKMLIQKEMFVLEETNDKLILILGLNSFELSEVQRSEIDILRHKISLLQTQYQPVAKAKKLVLFDYQNNPTYNRRNGGVTISGIKVTFNKGTKKAIGNLRLYAHGLNGSNSSKYSLSIGKQVFEVQCAGNAGNYGANMWLDEVVELQDGDPISLRATQGSVNWQNEYSMFQLYFIVYN